MRTIWIMQASSIEPISVYQTNSPSSAAQLWSYGPSQSLAKSLARSLVGVFPVFMGSNGVLRFMVATVNNKQRRTPWTHLFGAMTYPTHSCSRFVVFASCLDWNMSKRLGETPEEQVSAKSKLIRGPRLMNRSDGRSVKKGRLRRRSLR